MTEASTPTGPPSPSGLKRVAMVTVHTSPLAQPGEGDAGGMNVYVLEVARQLARRGIAVDLFTRTTSATQPAVVEVEPGVVVRHVPAGPYEGLSKEDLPGQLCAFRLLRTPPAWRNPAEFERPDRRPNRPWSPCPGRWCPGWFETVPFLSPLLPQGVICSDHPDPNEGPSIGFNENRAALCG